jgi:hypothetical protein
MKMTSIRLSDDDLSTLNALVEWAEHNGNLIVDSSVNISNNVSAAVRLAISIIDEIVIKPKKGDGSSYSLTELSNQINGTNVLQSPEGGLSSFNALRDEVQELRILMLNEFVMSHVNDLGVGNRNFQMPAGDNNPVKEMDDLLTIRAEDYREYLSLKSQINL